jgi:hypothetical protein
MPSCRSAVAHTFSGSSAMAASSVVLTAAEAEAEAAIRGVV